VGVVQCPELNEIQMFASVYEKRFLIKKVFELFNDEYKKRFIIEYFFINNEDSYDFYQKLVSILNQKIRNISKEYQEVRKFFKKEIIRIYNMAAEEFEWKLDDNELEINLVKIM
jgi:hypothetical protein